MIDPNSDELYEELRRKLADYGSQPSEEVWANIRQRVPATPLPALRTRTQIRRRVWAASLLLLLFSGVLVASYYRQAWFGSEETTVAVVPPARSEQAAPSASVLPNHSATSGAASLHGTVPSSSIAPTKEPVAHASVAPSEAIAASPSLASTTRRQQLESQAQTQAAAATASTVTRRSQRTVTRPNLARTQPASTPLPALGSVRSIKRDFIVATRSSASSDPDSTVSVEDKTGHVAAATTATQVPDLALPTQASATEPALLSPLSIALRLPLPQAPTVTPVPSPTATPPPPPTIATRRLAVQLLAGPAISYRHLGRRGTDSLMREVEELERPAESYSAELGLTYALTPRLTLLAGLGYTEYATRLDLTVKQPVVVYASFRRPVLQYTNGVFNAISVPDSVASGSDEEEQRIRHRDVYRFISVPLQVQYQLGTAGRFSYGVALGATANLYVGGRTAQTGDCGCEQQTWKLSNNPFRVASLGFTAGTTIGYRLAARWHLNLQPTFNYLLTPLAHDQTRSARHLLSAGMRTGVSFDLR